MSTHLLLILTVIKFSVTFVYFFQLEFPGYFPFEIVDNPGEKIFQLKRQFEDETITVQVDIPNVAPQQSEDEAGPEKNENDSESSIPLVVTIFKGNGVCMEFGVTAFPDEVVIDSLSIKNPDESEDQLVYEGPEFT
jgi:complement component 1 Q subcomponent-binding protein, mitochondrial